MFSKLVKGIVLFIISLVLLMVHWILFILFILFMIWRSRVKRNKLIEAEQIAKDSVIDYSEMFEVTRVTEDNEDGKNKQDVLIRCYGGDKITLKHFSRDEKTPVVEVWTKFGMIGYLNPNDAAKHEEFFRTRESSTGMIKQMIGGAQRNLPISCKVVIDVTVQENEDDEPNEDEQKVAELEQK